MVKLEKYKNIVVKYLRYIATLFITCLALSGPLSIFFNVVHPGSAHKVTYRELYLLKEVLPQAHRFDTVKDKDDVLYYKAFDRSNKMIGYVFKAFKKGYSSYIVTMVGMKTNGIITRVNVLSQNETPGLGTRIFEWKQNKRPEFLSSLEGRNILSLDGRIDAVTGSTISSRAVIDSIKDKAREVLGSIKP